MSGLTTTRRAIRHEIRYGSRVVRCFAERPVSLDAMFRAAVARFGDRDALVLGDTRITYRALDETVERVAANLVRQGFEPGERVALLLGNGLEFFYAFLAAARAGLIAVPMNIRQRRPEIEFVLNQCEAAALIYDAPHEPNLPERATVPSLRQAYVVRDGAAAPFADLLTSGAPVAFPAVAEEDALCLLYTSGTTGKPKGAMLTHVSTIHSLIHFEQGLSLTSADVSVLAVPVSHVTGLVAVFLALLAVGGTIVIMPAFKARAFLELAARERMTFSLMVPAMYNLCLLDPEFAASDLRAWRVAGFGGAPMPSATIERLAETLPNLALSNIYGSTETSSPVTLLPLGDIARKPASVGKVLPCADVIIVDDEGREVPPGETGEILIGGAMVVPGYWNNPDGDRAGFVGGYWISGDIGSMDADGYLHVFDRKKDMINRAGFKIYCIEVESVMTHHPSVVEAAVVGAPDPVLGERAHAFIFADGRPFDAADIKRFCAERLSDYKVPDTVTSLDEPLPRNANGKVLKTALRQLLEQRS